MLARKSAKWNASDAGKLAQRKYRDSVRERLDAYKLSRGCADCGYAVDAVALDFDHVRGDKHFNIGSYYACSWDKISAEVAKCEVVCSNCHRIRTRDRRINV